MNRYWAFVMDHYYPSGGMGDCVGKFKTLEEAEKYLETQFGDYKYIIDIIEESKDEEVSPVSV
jgi:hypothetical protein